MQGSVLLTLTASAIQGEQAYGPYGNQRYVQGTIGTDKGYTGQFQDALTGLDYYNARYYDPVMGQFLSPDVKQGNGQGMDPYTYVAGNPETLTDPSGQRYAGGGGCGSDPSDSCGQQTVNNPAPTGAGNNGDTWEQDPTMNPQATNPGCKLNCGKNGGDSEDPQCGSGTHQEGSKCVANTPQCGKGTVLENNQCVSDANSKDGQYRSGHLSGKQAFGVAFEIAGYLALFLGDLMLAAGAKDAVAWLEIIIDMLVLVTTNIFPLLHISGWVSTWILAGLGLAEGAIALVRKLGWFGLAAANAAVATLQAGIGGPTTWLGKAMLFFARPIVGNLVDAGSHFLLSIGFGLLSDYQDQMDMPILQWCAKYGGCPAGDS